MYNVLNTEGNRITVKEINGTIHRHLSGRDFTDQELERFGVKKSTPTTEQGDIEQAREAYKEKLGKNVPNNKKNDLEWITNKLK